MMEHTSQSHRNAVNNYLKSNSVAPIRLSATEVNKISALLTRFVGEVGNLDWLGRIFLHSLDAYWGKIGTSQEIALRYEGTIGSYMHQVVIGRQFSRIPAGSTSRQIEYNSVTITGFDRFWHPYYDPDLPGDIESFEEPYRTLYSLVKYLSAQMLVMASNEKAMRFLASLLGAFALSYPIEYLDTDLNFQRYLENEVQETPVDDDYTYYLCRMMDYSIFDRS